MKELSDSVRGDVVAAPRLAANDAVATGHRASSGGDGSLLQP